MKISSVYKVLLAFVFGVGFSLSSFAGVSHVRVEGIIVKFDKSTVTLQQIGRDREQITVRKESIPSIFRIEVGVLVYADLSAEEINDLIEKIKIRNR